MYAAKLKIRIVGIGKRKNRLVISVNMSPLLNVK